MSSLNVTARLTETITVKRPLSYTDSGDPTFDTAFTCSARVERAMADVADGQGRKQDDGTKVITTTELLVGDVLWLAEDTTSVVSDGRKVLNVKQNRALDGSVISYSSTV